MYVCRYVCSGKKVEVEKNYEEKKESFFPTKVENLPNNGFFVFYFPTIWLVTLNKPWNLICCFVVALLSHWLGKRCHIEQKIVCLWINQIAKISVISKCMWQERKSPNTERNSNTLSLLGANELLYSN